MNKSYLKGQEVEIRVIGGNLFIKGFLPTNILSHRMFHRKRRVFYKEKIKPQAFSNALKKEQPKLLLQHDHSKELKVVNFTWSEGQKGLLFEAEVKVNEELIKNLDAITGISFGFFIDEEVWERESGEIVRTVISFKKLIEISILHSQSEPAYPFTSIKIDGDNKVLDANEVEKIKNLINKYRLEEMKKAIEELKRGIR